MSYFKRMFIDYQIDTVLSPDAHFNSPGIVLCKSLCYNSMLKYCQLLRKYRIRSVLYDMDISYYYDLHI